MSDILVRAIDPASPTSEELERARQERIAAQGIERTHQLPTPTGRETDPLPPLPEVHQGQILSRLV